jgi:hypothetical protein
MRTGSDPDGPEPPGPTGVRPYLGGVGPGGQFRPPVRIDDRPRDARGGPPPAGRATALRPFVITSGRVASTDPEIGMETQVTAHPGAVPARLSPEQRAIVALCTQPRSVAEISAQLRLHLGVTRILVGDLRAARQLDVQVLRTDFPDPETIMRVIRGLRAIS